MEICHWQLVLRFLLRRCNVETTICLRDRFGSGLLDCSLNLIESTGKPFSTMMMLAEDHMDPAFKPFRFGSGLLRDRHERPLVGMDSQLCRLRMRSSGTFALPNPDRPIRSQRG